MAEKTLYDVAILGAGPGGYEAAIRASQLGLRVALIEAKDVGGTCLNWGCLPTKALLQSAHIYQEAMNAAEYGVSLRDLSFDYAAMAARKDKVVCMLRRGVERLERENHVDIIRGRGCLTDTHTVDVEGKPVEARNIILATGSAPVMPPIPGIHGKNIVTSKEALAFQALPDEILIIGGGIIGIEFATLFAALGKRVTVIEMLPAILSTVDGEIAALAAAALERQGVKLLTGAKVLAFSDEERVSVSYERDGKIGTAQGDVCIVSTGRKPVTEDMGLEAAGIAIERGFVIVDDELRTSIPNIFAIGDITGKIPLAHMAGAQGLCAAANCAGQRRKMRYDIVPSCVYCEPEIAFIGLTSAEAEAAGHKIRVGRFDVGTNGKALIMGSSGLVKIVTDAATGEILGAQLYGPRVTEFIAEIAAVMRCEGTIEELADTIHPHPSVSEVLMEAAHDVEGLCVNAMPKR